jgi:hypothetical protein
MRHRRDGCTKHFEGCLVHNVHPVVPGDQWGLYPSGKRSQASQLDITVCLRDWTEDAPRPSWWPRVFSFLIEFEGLGGSLAKILFLQRRRKAKCK